MEAKAPTKVRVTNITKRAGGPGHFLDPGDKFGNRMIAPGHSMLFECKDGHVPDCVDEWLATNSVMVEDAMNGNLIAGPVSGEISPGQISPVREMTGADDDDDLFGENDIDLNEAREAQFPGNDIITENTDPIRGNISQQRRARVSLGSRDEGSGGQGLSPIPGDIPRSVDESDQFTIKAPRSHSIGTVIGKK